jgi:hypothetical protein
LTAESYVKNTPENPKAFSAVGLPVLPQGCLRNSRLLLHQCCGPRSLKFNICV